MSFVENIDKWQALLAILDLDEKLLERDFSDESLKEFESNSKIRLPLEYKLFCKTFHGGGTFGDDYISIYSPVSPEKSNEYLSFFRSSIERMRRWNGLSSLDYLVYESLLNSAFLFGGSSRGEIFVWDLRTYREDDSSYDIYLLCIDDPLTYLVGRDFFRFVRDFCLGTEAIRRLPEGSWINPQEISFKFS